MENQLLNSKKKSFGLFEAALATILFIIFNFIFTFVYSMVPAGTRSNKIVYYIASFAIEAFFAVVAYVVAITRKVDLKTASGMNKKINFNCVFYAVLISFVSLIFFGNLTNVFIAFLEMCGYSSILGTIEIPNFGTYLIYVFVSCLVPAFCEDLLFRGVIASGLKEKGFKVALYGSAIIFTFMHGNPEQTVHQFIIGLIVGYIFLKSGNVWLGILVHFVNNFVAVTSVYATTLASGGVSEPVAAEATTEAMTVGTLDSAITITVSFVVALILAFIGYLIIKKLIDKIIRESEMLNSAQKTQENATIKVDENDVAVQMTIDGKAIEEASEQSKSEETKNDKKETSFAVVIMFVLSGAYFAIEWLSSLLSGLGMF